MAASQNVDNSADNALAKMGYKVELQLNLSMIPILGLYATKDIPHLTHPIFGYSDEILRELFC
ncbi:unnamed protein product [Tuber aestivum]|uniref:Uncharacterized protein n=1 Tax=Tuber aestivum TaxID=59557 RepID=A0A292Q8W3_9PEZI|nr:unnamed protein product [Tuber aestivum]